jgi:erythronate-4-phosphate dehydrogenase
MKIVADDKIPFLKGVLEPFADVVYLPGQSITANDVRDADAILTRTRTRCDKALLEGSRVRFIGTATIGYDHIDTRYCEEKQITWKNAPGCNAGSVNQYMASALTSLAKKEGFPLSHRVLGVVGVGNVGSKVVSTAEMLGMRVYLCDPPRVRNEGVCGFISLEGILRECDILTFHVPLNPDGEDRTYHMVDEDLIARINPGTYLMNTSRGEVVDSMALKRGLASGKIAGAVLDVWEHEPDIDPDLMNSVIYATPHIAGYSADGKARGTSMIVRELGIFFDLPVSDWEPEEIPEPANPVVTIECMDRDEEDILADAIRATYRVEEDDRRLRLVPGDFEKQRGQYPVRREFKAYTLELLNGWPEIKKTCRRVGFNIV